MPYTGQCYTCMYTIQNSISKQINKFFGGKYFFLNLIWNYFWSFSVYRRCWMLFRLVPWKSMHLISSDSSFSERPHRLIEFDVYIYMNKFNKFNYLNEMIKPKLVSVRMFIYLLGIHTHTHPRNDTLLPLFSSSAVHQETSYVWRFGKQIRTYVFHCDLWCILHGMSCRIVENRKFTSPV